MSKTDGVKIFGYPLKDFVTLMALLSGGTFVGHFTGNSGVDQEELTQHTANHDKELLNVLKTRLDSLVLSSIDNEAGERLIADAVGEDVETVKAIIEYGKANMDKDSLWDNYYMPHIDGLIDRFSNAFGYCYNDLNTAHTRPYFMTADGTPELIRFGRPRDRPGIRREVFYYTNRDNEDVVLHSLLNAVKPD